MDVGKGITPSDGSKLSFFETGTSTPKDTFTTEAATTPNANPVIADSNGVFPDIFITGTYKVTLTDKNDVQSGFGEADPVEELAQVATTPTISGNDKRYGPFFTTVAAMIAPNPVSVDGVVVNLVPGMTIETQGRTAAGDGGDDQFFIKTAAAFGGTPDEQGASFTLDSGDIAVSLSETSHLLRFGADKTGVALADTAIDACIADAESRTGIYEAPEGNFLIASQHVFKESGTEIRAVTPGEEGTEAATTGTRYTVQALATPTSAFFFGRSGASGITDGINVLAFGAVIGNGLTKAFEFKRIRHSSFRNMLANDVTRAYDQIEVCFGNYWENFRAFDYDIGMRTDSQCEDSEYHSGLLRSGRSGSRGWLSNFSAHVHTLVNCDISNNEIDIACTNSNTRTEMILINCQLETGTVSGKIASIQIQSTDHKTSLKMIGGRISNTSGVNPSIATAINAVSGCETLDLQDVKIDDFTTTVAASSVTAIKTLRIHGVTENSTTAINASALLSGVVDIQGFSDGSFDKYSLRQNATLLDFDGSSGGSNTIDISEIVAGASYLLTICDTAVPNTFQTGVVMSKGGFTNGTFTKIAEATGSNTFTVSVAGNVITVTASVTTRDANATLMRLT
jgi:hypothetical protein